MDISLDEDDRLDAIELFSVKANHGPDWVFDLSTLDNETEQLCDEEGNEVDAITRITDRRVIINAALPLWLQHERTLHELLHVVFDGHGIDWLTDEKEETLVRYLSPRLWGHLETLGFKWPKRPKACEQLCKQAKLESA